MTEPDFAKTVNADATKESLKIYSLIQSIERRIQSLETAHIRYRTDYYTLSSKVDLETVPKLYEDVKTNMISLANEFAAEHMEDHIENHHKCLNERLNNIENRLSELAEFCEKNHRGSDND